MRRLRTLLTALAIVALLVPAAARPVRAALAAPILVSPVGSSAASPIVDFNWLRVPGAAAYRIRVWHESPAGALLVDERTVNDRFITRVNLQGDVAAWSVSAIDGDDVEGAAATATFTTIAAPATLVWPADGATVSFPGEAATLQYDAVSGQTGWPWADHAVGTQDPFVDSAPTVLSPGAWRWAVGRSDVPPTYGPIPWSETRQFTYSWPDATPTLTAPAAGATSIQGDTIELAWSAVDGASFYAWEVRGSDDAVVAQSINGVRATWVELGGWLHPDTYTWRVRSVMAGSEDFHPVFGPWSATRSFAVHAPPAPSPLSPSDGASLTSWPVLRWTDVAGARAYQVQIGTSIDDGTPPINPTTLTSSFSFSRPGSGAGLAESTTTTATRWWRVRAYGSDSFDDLGGWSAWRSFTVDPPAGSLANETQATPLGPADCTSDACPDLDGVPLLRWSPVPKAASYRVFLRPDGGSGPPTSWVDVGSTGWALNGYAQPSPGDRMAWAVLACPIAGCSETMPATRSHFRVSIPAPAPLSADGLVQGGPSVAMRWAALPAPVQPDTLKPVVDYEVTYTQTKDGGGVDRYFPYLGKALAATIDAVPGGATIDWQVRAKAQLAYVFPTDGAWSEARSVTRDEPPITLISPIDDAVVPSRPVLDWAGLPFDTLGYTVQVARVTALDLYGSEWSDWTSFTGATSIRPGPLAPGAYRWRVARAETTYHQEEGPGLWSTGTFVVEGDPEIHPTAPAAGATIQANDVTLEWAPVGAATEYSVMIGPSADLTWDTAIYHGYSFGTVHPVAATLPQGDLYWRVCTALNCSNVAAFGSGPIDLSSAPRKVHVVTPAADATPPASRISGVTPRAGSTLGTTGAIPVTITWTAMDAGGAVASQELRIRQGSGAWTTLAVGPSSRSATTTLAGAAAYTVQIRATDDHGNTGAWSSFGLTTSLAQESATGWTWSSGWTRSALSGASGGFVRWATKAGATATTSITGRAMAIVAPRSTTGGWAEVWVDRAKVATIKLDAAPTGPRRIVFTRTWTRVSTHTILIKVLGTAGHPRVDLDALVVLR